MVIASIDIQNGKVVQLKQGTELVLQRDNAGELAEEFGRYGDVAVIDLDAAMGRPLGSPGSNTEMIKPLLRKAQCRVGGGIRTPEQAAELISLGAQKVIIGSAAFRLPDGGAGVNLPLLEAFAKRTGRSRLIAAVDARNGEIMTGGWKTPAGIGLIEAARAVEPFVSELLFTCVEREGTMTGIDMEQVKKLRAAVSCQVTVAGGVSTLGEISGLAALGCDVQLGMALYTGKVSLAGAFVCSLNWAKGGEASPPAPSVQGRTPLPPSTGAESGMDAAAGTPAPVTPPHRPLLPLIAQSTDGQVLMTGFTGEEALYETFKRGNLCFHSRTRNRLWMKGENSGNTLKLVRLRADCDRDAVLAVVEPAGPVCHTGAWSCFSVGRRYTWELLQEIIAGRFRNPVPGSYTASLDGELVREKVMEEAGELCAAENHDGTVWEAADLLYFTTALITRAGVQVGEVLDELERRHLK